MTTDSSPNNDHPELPQAGEEIPPTEAQADFSAGPIGPHQLPTLQPVMISRYLKQGWQLLWDRPGPYIGYTLLLLVLAWILERLGTLGTLAQAVVTGPLLAGYYYSLSRHIRNQETRAEQLLEGLGHFVPLMLVSLVASIAISLGFLLLVLPGIYLAVSYMLALPLVQDRGLDFWPALETSRRLIGRQWFSFFGLGLVLFVINLAGGLLFGLGLLITLPLTMATLAATYHHQVGFNAP